MPSNVIWGFVYLSIAFVLGLGLGGAYCLFYGTKKPHYKPAEQSRSFYRTCFMAFTVGTSAGIPLLALGALLGTFSFDLPTSAREVCIDIVKIFPLWIGGDLLGYFYHRFLEHNPKTRIFYRAHAVHHEYVHSNSPVTGFYTHWVEMFFTTQLGTILFVLLPGSSIFCFATHVVLVGITTMIGHCDIADDGVASQHHRRHHTHPERNFSETWEIIDVIFGTKYDPKKSDNGPSLG